MVDPVTAAIGIAVAVNLTGGVFWAGSVHQKLKDLDNKIAPVVDLGKLCAELRIEVKALNKRLDRDERRRVNAPAPSSDDEAES